MPQRHNNMSQIIPHRSPMVMVDGFEKESETAGTCTKQFHPGSFGCENGFVLQGILIECLAQTVAAQHGYDSFLEENPDPAVGMLVTIDQFEFLTRVPDDALITIKACKTDEIGDFHLISGEIHHGEKLVARGRIKIFSQSQNRETQA